MLLEILQIGVKTRQLSQSLLLLRWWLAANDCVIVIVGVLSVSEGNNEYGCLVDCCHV